jgi:hypothetical protein
MLNDTTNMHSPPGPLFATLLLLPMLRRRGCAAGTNIATKTLIDILMESVAMFGRSGDHRDTSVKGPSLTRAVFVGITPMGLAGGRVKM